MGSGVLPPSFLLFSSRGCRGEADENNLHASERKGETGKDGASKL